MSKGLFTSAFCATLFFAATTIAVAAESRSILRQSQLDKLRHAARVKRPTAFEFDVLGKRYEMTLKPVTLHAPSFRAEITDSKAERVSWSPTPEISHFRGFLTHGQSELSPYLSITWSRNHQSESLQGALVVPEEARIYGFESLTVENSGDTVLQVFEAPFQDDEPRTCGITPELEAKDANFLPVPSQVQSEMPSGLVAMSSANPLMVELAVEVDYTFVNQNGGVAGAQAKVETVLNSLNAIYEMQAGLTFRLTYIHLWQTANDPYSSTIASDLLTQFRNHWNSNFSNVNRDLAHLWSGIDLSGTTIGISYNGSTCSLASAYGLSTNFPVGNGFPNVATLVTLMSHEVGHSFNAVHDASCPGFIMCSDLNPSNPSDLFSNFTLSTITQFTGYLSCLSPSTVSCPADLDGNGQVDSFDLALLLSDWGFPGCGGEVPCQADINSDGTVNAADLSVTIFKWGACEP